MGEKETQTLELHGYRIEKLEEAVQKLTALSDVIVRWDAKFTSQGTFMNCVVHQNRMDSYEKKLDEIYKITVERTKGYLEIEQHDIAIKAVQEEVSELKSYMNKAIGALVIISIVIQLLGPVAVDWVKGHTHPQVQVEDSVAGFGLNLTNRSR